MNGYLNRRDEPGPSIIFSKNIGIASIATSEKFKQPPSVGKFKTA
jgi:hypothetical protein